MGATDQAVDALAGLELRASITTQHWWLHAKAYLFNRNSV
jgi:hypothetical protein